MKRVARQSLILVVFLLAGTSLLAEEQIITPDPLLQIVAPGASFGVEVTYTTDPPEPMLTGIGLQVHFDSSKVSFVQLTEVFESGLIVNPDLVTPEPDTDDDDGDANTDQLVLIAWFDFAGEWPGVLPVQLFTINLEADSAFNGVTRINFSASDQPPGYTFYSLSATIAEPSLIFIDGFESGDTMAWSSTVGGS